MSWFEKYSNHVYALLRIVSGLLFAIHGAQKLFGLFGNAQPPAGSQLWIGAVLELVGGAAILVGFRTRLAAFLCSGMMAVAYIQYHWRFELGTKFWPTVNQGELAVMYCFLFLYLASRGGVKWAMDKKG